MSPRPRSSRRCAAVGSQPTSSCSTTHTREGRRFTFSVLHDQLLTPLFSYVAILNALVAYERQNGAMTVTARGTLSFGADGQVDIDDVYVGDTTVALAATGVTNAVAAAATNEFRATLPERLDLTLRVAERQESATIERASPYAPVRLRISLASGAGRERMAATGCRECAMITGSVQYAPKTQLLCDPAARPSP